MQVNAKIVDDFKAAFRTQPASVAIIAAQTKTGRVGLTASSVASVALDPPSLSFSVTRATGSAGGLLSAGTLMVHLLASHQADLANKFAKTGLPRFTEDQGWRELPTGEPWLPDALAALRCRISGRFPVGSSNLVVVEVLDSQLGTGTEPLVYQNQRYGVFTPFQ